MCISIMYIACVAGELHAKLFRDAGVRHKTDVGKVSSGSCLAARFRLLDPALSRQRFEESQARGGCTGRVILHRSAPLVVVATRMKRRRLPETTQRSA